jgi:hypothetical protein
MSIQVAAIMILIFLIMGLVLGILLGKPRR